MSGLTPAAARGLPRHPRLLERAPESVAEATELRPLSSRLWELRKARTSRPIPVRNIFKLGRDLAEALTCLHLVDLTAGQVEVENIYVDAEMREACLLPRPPSPVADHDPLESTPFPDALRSDLIQLGVVLFELCCRRALRPREDLCHLRQGFALVSLMNPQVPPEGDAVITQLLETTPGHGYRRAKQVLDDLRRVVTAIDQASGGGPAPAPESRTVTGRKVEDVLGGWAPQRERDPAASPRADEPVLPGAAPYAGRRGLQGAAAVLMVAFALLRLLAPVPAEAREPTRARALSAASLAAPAGPVASGRPPSASARMKQVLAQRAAARRRQ